MQWAEKPLSCGLHLVRMFSHKIIIHSNSDSDFDFISDEEGALAHQAQGTMHLGIPLWVKNCPILAKSLL
jgi:hypothetical protein